MLEHISVIYGFLKQLKKIVKWAYAVSKASPSSLVCCEVESGSSHWCNKD